ncbi:ubiquinol-cytochrome c reductase iron-sulfur subunit [Sinorhizobium numidicum]|uniref:Ubiquinol-cytochrome c reductase iron-sulfur subunit n=1 Tax=Sinorhizobium numidicum TaxID=680248 RepID=A0ABY8CWZ7_9HYPH|nr:ubiquinol-cytochrome c reductase iron-sulfur subunit [Sinorhizobium numidicum]WEX75479.1 ubiquinol-cytochrome c reductase iron-sulfur subunit [Sinorhizobium numidicum]WEX81476.1 ubiquinol-cytochrome c reductase iron-sulfur subunit [Sinorhizobium numidicum]
MTDAVEQTEQPREPTRRDFLYLCTGMATLVGGAAFLWPFIDSMQPSADVTAMASVEFDISLVEPGQRVTIKWRGKPVFIVRRSEQMIAQAREDDDSPALIDPVADSERAPRPEWLVLVGVCTHLGCIPLGQQDGDPRGPHDGWFCPCHGSIYDVSGRVRKGPAPRNLEVPPYSFTADNRIIIG